MQHLRQLEAATARRQALGMRLMLWGELLNVLRPVIYTLALRKYASCMPHKLSCGRCLGRGHACCTSRNGHS